MDVGDLECDGLSDRGQVRAVNDNQFVIAELRKSMVVHRSSMALVEQSPLFGDTLGHLLMVADTGGETADPRVSAIAVRTIADSCSTSSPGSIGSVRRRMTTSCRSWSRPWSSVTSAFKPWPTPRPGRQRWAPS